MIHGNMFYEVTSFHPLMFSMTWYLIFIGGGRYVYWRSTLQEVCRTGGL